MDDLVQSQRGDIFQIFRGNYSASKILDEWAIVAVEEEQPSQANGNSESDQHEENVDTNIGHDIDIEPIISEFASRNVRTKF